MVTSIIIKKYALLQYKCYRTEQGRLAAKKRGVRFGRPVKMNTLAKRLLQEESSVSDIAKTFNVHKATIYRLKDSNSIIHDN